MNEHEKVKQFHEAMGVPVATTPTMPDEATCVLRCRLLLEETLEFIQASGCGLAIDKDTGRWNVLATHEPDLAAMAQENEDVVYIAMGNQCAIGTNFRVFDEVHRANMAKVGPDGVRKDERGKVLKPEGWTPPDVARVLAEWDLDNDPWERAS